MATGNGEQAEILALQKVRRHQRILFDLGRLSVKRMVREAFLHEVCLLVTQALEVDKAKIMRFRAEEGDLLAEVGVGWKPGVVGGSTFSLDLASPQAAPAGPVLPWSSRTLARPMSFAPLP